MKGLELTPFTSDAFLQSRLQEIPHRDVLDAEEAWWKNEGVAISNAIDRAGTPWLRMFDRLGKRVDEILYPREYQTILKERLPGWSRLARSRRKIADPHVSADVRHFVPRSGHLLPLHRVAWHRCASCEIWQRRIAGSLSASTLAKRRFRVAGRHVDDGDQRRLGSGSRCRDDCTARGRSLASHRRKIFHEQCRRRVSRCCCAPGRSCGGRARPGIVPRAAIPQ